MAKSPTKYLIVVLGHRNNLKGELSEIAKDRCAKACYIFVKLKKQGKKVQILPCGGTGYHFNKTKKPHGGYLKSEILKIVKGKRISSGDFLDATTTCGTQADLEAAKANVAHQNSTNIVIVSSDYHMKRVQFLTQIIFGLNTPVSFIEVSHTKKNLEKELDVKLEPLKYKNLMNEFSSDLSLTYQNADREHKHYDTVSVAIISGMFIVFYFAFQLYEAKVFDSRISTSIWLITTIIQLTLLIVYLQCASFARRARLVLKNIEAIKFVPPYSNKDVFGFNSYPTTSLPPIILVCMLVIGMILVCASFWLFFASFLL